MKFLNILAIGSLIFFISSCKEENSKKIHFATSAQYPPFEYIHNNKIKGFDIDLARLIAKEMHKEAVFDDMQFSTVLPALSSGKDDAAIATLTITEQRKQNFSFTKPYYFQTIAVIFKVNHPIKQLDQLNHKKVAVQLGSVMEIWLKKNVPTAQLTAMDNSNQTIEALKAGHVDAVLIDGVQAKLYSKNNPQLAYQSLGNTKDGFGIALPKNSPLTAQINQALLKLQATGEIKKLENKWLEETSWAH